MTTEGLYARPRSVDDLDRCYFYHTIEIPGIGVIEGDWDLREGIEDYLGHVDLARKRVLEIGPATGLLTFEMEARGAEVVGVELCDRFLGDIVPYASLSVADLYEDRRDLIERVTNSFWFCHRRLGSKSRIHYGKVYDLPGDLGHFDVSVIATVLLHSRDPFKIVENCVRHTTSTIVITEMYADWMEKTSAPLMKLVPSPENGIWHTYWEFTPDFFLALLGVLGFEGVRVSRHVHEHRGRPYRLYTVVGERAGNTQEEA